MITRSHFTGTNFDLLFEKRNTKRRLSDSAPTIRASVHPQIVLMDSRVLIFITRGLSAIGKLRGLPFVTIAIALTDDFPALFGIMNESDCEQRLS
jgi:hypothetical protein